MLGIAAGFDLIGERLEDGAIISIESCLHRLVVLLAGIGVIGATTDQRQGSDHFWMGDREAQGQHRSPGPADQVQRLGHHGRQILDMLGHREGSVTATTLEWFENLTRVGEGLGQGGHRPGGPRPAVQNRDPRPSVAVASHHQTSVPGGRGGHRGPLSLSRCPATSQSASERRAVSSDRHGTEPTHLTTSGSFGGWWHAPVEMSAPSGRRAVLVLVTGPPASGKSTVAEALARRLGANVLGWDWAMAALTGFDAVWSSIRALEGPEYRAVGWSLLFSLAEAQLREGRSVVLDGVARDAEVADTLMLARKIGADGHVVALRCDDAAERRRRVQGRRRNIPGWHELTVEHVEDMHRRWDAPAEADVTIETATIKDPDQLAGTLVGSWYADRTNETSE